MFCHSDESVISCNVQREARLKGQAGAPWLWELTMQVQDGPGLEKVCKYLSLPSG